MRLTLTAAAALGALIAAGAAAAAPARHAAAPARNWLAATAATPFGFRFGNPAAAHSLVEYGALNCPHCAHFAATVMPGVAAAVRGGKLSYEYRPIPIFPHDVPATLILRCTPARARFAFIADYYRSAAELTKKLQAAARDDKVGAEYEAAAKAGFGPANRKLVALTGMGAVAARHGLGAAAVDRCVADPGNQNWLQANQDHSRDANVEGTPTFEWDGKRVPIDSPADLDRLLAGR